MSQLSQVSDLSIDDQCRGLYLQQLLGVNETGLSDLSGPMEIRNAFVPGMQFLGKGYSKEGPYLHLYLGKL